MMLLLLIVANEETAYSANWVRVILRIVQVQEVTDE